MAFKVDRSTIMGDILDRDPAAAAYFLQMGMHCLSCPASRMESLEEACEVHGVEVEELLLGKNYYIDTSMGASEGLSPEQAVRMFRKHDSEKILFGSDCPWENPRTTFEYIDSLPVPDAMKENIFCRNALRLLKPNK